MTAICNCPDEIGWLPETSWPYTEAFKASAQPIYCIDGDPAVPPRGGFKSDWSDVSVVWTPSGGAGTVDAWTASGGVRALSGAVIADQSICNPYAYPLQLMAHNWWRWRVSLTGTATLALNSKMKVDGVDYDSSISTYYGNNTVAIREIVFSSVYKLAEIPVGGCITLGQEVTWTNSDPTSALSGMGSFVGRLRVWGGSI